MLVVAVVVVVASSASVLDMLVDEQQTWQLVTSLYRDRLDTRTGSDITVIIIDDIFTTATFSFYFTPHSIAIFVLIGDVKLQLTN